MELLRLPSQKSYASLLSLSLWVISTNTSRARNEQPLLLLPSLSRRHRISDSGRRLHYFLHLRRTLRDTLRPRIPLPVQRRLSPLLPRLRLLLHSLLQPRIHAASASTPSIGDDADHHRDDGKHLSQLCGAAAAAVLSTRIVLEFQILLFLCFPFYCREKLTILLF